MSLKSDIYIGLRNFRNYHRGGLSLRSFMGAVLSIGLSMVPIIVVLEVSSGMIDGITRRYIEVSSFHLSAGTYSEYVENDLEGILDNLDEISGIRKVTPFIEGQGLVYSKDGRTGVQIKGIDSQIYTEDTGFRENINLLQGEFDFGEDRRGLLLSRAIADELGVENGDPVKLLVSRTSPGRSKPLLKPGNYRVTGIFTTGYHELDRFSVYMDRTRAERIFGKEGTLGIGIKTDDYSEDLGELREEVQKTLPDSWYVVTWHDQERSLYRSLETTKTMLLFIMAIIIIVAAVNISSSMLNLVMEKQEQIAVLKSMGCSPGSIRIQFMITGFVTGLLGVAAGITLGLLISVNINQAIGFVEEILNRAVFLFKFLANPLSGAAVPEITLINPEYYLEDIPLKIPEAETMVIGGFTMLSAVLASWFPAKKASEILPLEILRRHG